MLLKSINTKLFPKSRTTDTATHIIDPLFGGPVDIYSSFLKNRIIYIGTEIYPEMTNMVISQLLYLESLNQDEEIKIYINSPGGTVYDGMAIYDTMRSISCPTKTVCIGLAASMASVLLLSGDKRIALPHSRIMLHQPLGYSEGQASDIEIANREIQKVKSELYKIIENHTQESIENIIKTCDRDSWLSVEEALKFGKKGIIDSIIPYLK